MKAPAPAGSRRCHSTAGNVFHDPLFYSMACIIAFGLALGTVLSLLVVPVLYSLFFNVKESSGTKSPAIASVTGAPFPSAG